jgi:transcriptional regulator with XRE-family HTH domain
MDALNFLEKHGKDVAERVAKKAGTNFAYYSQIAHGHRRPSVDLADRLVVASAEEVEDPEDRLDLLALLKPKEQSAAA